MTPGGRWGGSAAALLCAVLAACTGGGADAPRPASPSPRPLQWAQVTLPDGIEPVALASEADVLVVGGYAAAAPRPRVLSTTTGDAPFREAGISPYSPKAFDARWLAVVVTDSRVFGVGGARGGAHANVRWTTWSGDPEAVAEDRQPFETFGGWGAGDLMGMALAGKAPVIVGAWQSEGAGSDVAVWLLDGRRWKRQASTGTPLASTTREMVLPTSVAARGDGLIVTGSTTVLGDGSVSVKPSVWTTDSGAGPWRRTDLPGADAQGESFGAGCRDSTCLVVGRDGADLAFWGLDHAGARRLTDAPAVTLPERARALAPVAVGALDVVAVPVEGSTRLLVRDGSAWSAVAGPRGRPIAAVVHGGELLLATQVGDATSLWRARL